ncbi:MAG: NUDIX domain-containing protein [Devosia sp.]
MARTIAASVAIVRRDDVLLIQRHRPPSEGLWTLPGGRLETGETAEAAAIREVREELGLAVYALRPLGGLTHGAFRLEVFGTQAFEGDIIPDPAEVRAWRWVRPMQLAGLDTTEGLDEVLARAFRLFDRT